MTPTTALTIAGVDSSGGAGIHADLKTFYAHGLHGATAVAALTAQNTIGVQGVHVPPASFLTTQISSVLDDLDVRAVKTGMLATADCVRAVAAVAADGRLPNLVVDPVMVASTGARLLDEDSESAYIDALVPHATVLTPNRAEAGVLVGRDLRTTDDLAAAAQELARLGPEVVVITGGGRRPDGEGDQSLDVVADRTGRIRWLVAPCVDTANDHGTGCSFSAAVAARLALGDAVTDALDAAKAFVHRALTSAAGWRLGAGHGPIDHFGWNDPGHQAEP